MTSCDGVPDRVGTFRDRGEVGSSWRPVCERGRSSASSMNDPLHYRLSLDADLSPALLRALRATFVDFADRPVASLAQALRKRRRWVVCAGAEVDLHVLSALGVRVEPVGTYDADFVRSRLPRPIAFDGATERLEIVVQPSFDPEVVLHVWTEADDVCFHVTSPEVSLYARDFVLTRHREGERTWNREDVVVEERVRESDGMLANERRLPAWVHAIPAMPIPHLPTVSFDGARVALEGHTRYGRRAFEGDLFGVVAWLAEIVSAARVAGLDGDLLDRVGP